MARELLLLLLLQIQTEKRWVPRHCCYNLPGFFYTGYPTNHSKIVIILQKQKQRQMANVGYPSDI